MPVRQRPRVAHSQTGAGDFSRNMNQERSQRAIRCGYCGRLTHTLPAYALDPVSCQDLSLQRSERAGRNSGLEQSCGRVATNGAASAPTADPASQERSLPDIRVSAESASPDPGLPSAPRRRSIDDAASRRGARIRSMPPGVGASGNRAMAAQAAAQSAAAVDVTESSTIPVPRTPSSSPRGIRRTTPNPASTFAMTVPGIVMKREIARPFASARALGCRIVPRREMLQERMPLCLDLFGLASEPVRHAKPVLQPSSQRGGRP